MRQVFVAAAALALAAGPAMACDWHNKSTASVPTGEETVVMTPIPETPVEQNVANAETPVNTTN